ncbi:MAG: NADPH-dependent assimilatory sulfite reductase hemoprotein subunit [Bryobacteraceae bacterium]
MSTATSTPPSAVEKAKLASRHLRGQIVEELALATDGFAKETVHILKFHGIYQQNDRDARKSGGPNPSTSMVRVSIPGGVVTPRQYLALDRLADEAGDGSLRVTTRQDMQFHRVSKTNLRALMRTMNQNLLTTLAGCGDVVRNVVACPAPLGGAGREETMAYAQALSRRLKPRTRAYYEVWVDGEKAAAAESRPAEDEPLYGAAYLPRKFKIAFAAPGDNCVDVYTNDVGIVPMRAGGRLEGFMLLVGGGLGLSPGVRATHPRLGDPLGMVEPGQLWEVVEAVVAIHRDFGNRSNRKLARLKYVLDAWGLERFQTEVETRAGLKLNPAGALDWHGAHDHLGWHEQADGLWFLGLRVPDGRIKDREGVRLRTALRELAQGPMSEIRLTPQQNVLLTGISPENRSRIEAVLRAAGVPLVEQLPPILRHSMACPALPTCGQAVTEAERVSPQVLADIGARLGEAGLPDQQVVVRMTGCSNGCARPLTAEIGLVGESVDLYRIYLGGSVLGTRLAALFASGVPRSEIGARLLPVLLRYRDERTPGETFGDFCHRVGPRAPKAEPVAEAG